MFQKLSKFWLLIWKRNSIKLDFLDLIFHQIIIQHSFAGNIHIWLGPALALCSVLLNKNPSKASCSFQSDVVHQSVFELVHSEDRDELQRQLFWNSYLTKDQESMPLQVGWSQSHRNAKPWHSSYVNYRMSITVQLYLNITTAINN